MGVVSGLTESEREALSVWDDGSYTCPRRRGVCNERCSKQHTGLIATVERIVQQRVDAALGPIEAAIDSLPERTEGGDRIGTARWPERDRDTYSLAIEEAQVFLRAAIRDARGGASC